MNKVLTYIKSILVPLLIGGFVGLVTSNYIDYNNLIQPSFAPPAILFPIIWTLAVYLLNR